MPSGQISILSVKPYFKGTDMFEDGKPSRAFRISNTKKLLAPPVAHHK